MGFAKSGKTQIVGGAIDYYLEYEVTNLYVQKVFGGNVNTITVTNDSETDTAQVSFDGATLAGDLKPAESMSFNTSSKTSAYFKGTAGGDNIRIWGW